MFLKVVFMLLCHNNNKYFWILTCQNDIHICGGVCTMIDHHVITPFLQRPFALAKTWWWGCLGKEERSMTNRGGGGSATKLWGWGWQEEWEWWYDNLIYSTLPYILYPLQSIVLFFLQELEPTIKSRYKIIIDNIILDSPMV